ncbi:crocetin glucosyltransferase, chloroplastic [Brachypodium distachyon]|uniref:Glycosyltransferase n=1 Tax=Brachypodium distachyon TaxID=15368 RepID=I1HF38_BRADI|nr:crocetin glucosyltransferase, chloroplastic [Brachypodium distachyon]KQK04209.1 hypothetical protein BRADI_2g12347v3 [Brachypodium distachyon]|eukprot:XP_010230853.1 crocetin glucosyltransferase, chloroplastic [Brachypodium distachyon]
MESRRRENPPAPQPHLLFVTSPLQGHINPVRRLAARVAGAALVTVSTAVSGHRRMFPSLASPDEEAIEGNGMLHAPYSDGFDEGFDPEIHDVRSYGPRARAVGCETLSGVVARLARRGRPVTRVVYTFLVPWAPDVARAHGVPAALFWIQPAAVFAVYYHFFHGHEAVLASCADDEDGIVSLPGLPPLRPRALPSIVLTTAPEQQRHTVLQTLRELFLALDDDEQQQQQQHRPKVLVNTFDALEPEALRAVPQFELVAVGPVVPPEPDDASSPSSTDLSLFGGHDVEKQASMEEWLGTKAARSVVYVSFGSLIAASKRQEAELRRGLEATGRPYLWVSSTAAAADEEFPDTELLEGTNNGMVVDWCDQARVLSQPAVGCFVTHCGWNSALESVACGVPVVAVPQWTDQPTVAWIVEECAGVGVRARVDGEGVAEGGEIRRCVEAVMGNVDDVAVGIRANASRWRERAMEAIASAGTLDKNLRAFVSGLPRNALDG